MPKMSKQYWMEVLSKAEFTLLPWSGATTAELIEDGLWLVRILFPGDSLAALRTQEFRVEAFDAKGAIWKSKKFLPREIRIAFKTRNKARRRLNHPEDMKDEE